MSGQICHKTILIIKQEHNGDTQDNMNGHYKYQGLTMKVFRRRIKGRLNTKIKEQ